MQRNCDVCDYEYNKYYLGESFKCINCIESLNNNKGNILSETSDEIGSDIGDDIQSETEE